MELRTEIFWMTTLVGLPPATHRDHRRVCFADSDRNALATDQVAVFDQYIIDGVPDFDLIPIVCFELCPWQSRVVFDVLMRRPCSKTSSI